MEQVESSSTSTSSTSTSSSDPIEVIAYPLITPPPLSPPRSHSHSSDTSFHTPNVSPPSSPPFQQQAPPSALDSSPLIPLHATHPMPSLPTFMRRSSSFSSSLPSHTPPTQDSLTHFDAPLNENGKRNDSTNRPQEEYSREENEDGKRALGVKGGIKFLQRREVQEALQDAERFEEEGSGGSIRDQVESPHERRDRRGIERMQTDLLPERKKDTISTERTGQGSPESPSSRRKPVPHLSEPESLSTPSPPSRPQPSNSSSTPLALRQDPILNASPLLSRRAPPISGLNQIKDGHGRKRNDSSGSTGSVSKDSVLRELGEGIRKERRRKEMFEEEKRKARLELEEIEGNLVVMREKFNTSNDQQELTIRNLKAEIEEVEEEVAGADELDEATAQEYLSLLSSSSLSHLASSAPHVSSFDPSLLRSTSFNSPARPLNINPSKLSALTGMKRGLNLKRRIETHLAAYDSVSSNVLIPRQPVKPSSGMDENDSISQMKTGGRLRKLSKSRMASPPTQPIFSSPATISPHTSNDLSSPTHSIPPRPRRPPPISGQNSRKYSNGFPPNASTSDSEDTGKEMVRKGSLRGRMRKRSNSFKEGFNGTMRVLFPSNAPKGGQGGGNEQSINHWLRAGS